MSAVIATPLHSPARWALAAPRRALTSIRVAALVILLLGVVSLVGVLVPQAPPAVLQNASLEANWLDDQRATFGVLTPFMDEVGFFNVFHTWWFYSILGWVVVSIGVCTASRTPAILRQTFSPPHRVAEPLFERSATAHLSAELTAEQLEARLRRRWFRVHRETDGEIVYLFADRFSWAALGTFATHAGLILFLIGALVTKFDGFTAPLAIAEGQSAPVFPLGDDRHLIVGVDRAVGDFDSLGRPLDFRSELSLSQYGEGVKQCTITVNTPCSFDGYRFHQAGFFGYGVDLLVRDARTGATVYHETLALGESLSAPRITVSDRAGRKIFEGTVPLLDIIDGTQGALESFAAGDRAFWLELRAADDEWLLTVFDASATGDAESATIAPSDSATVGGLVFEFDSVATTPALVVLGLPAAAAAGDQTEVLVALQNAQFGTVDGGTESPASLRIAGLAPMAVTLDVNEPVTVGAYEYEFAGQRNFAGVMVRKDRGDTLIWIAGGLFLVGLVATLWFPRARAWFRFTEGGEGRMYSTGRWKVDESDLID